MPTEIVMNGFWRGRHFAGFDRYVSELLPFLGSGVRVIQPPAGLSGLPGLLWEQLQLPRLAGKESLLWSQANLGPLAITRQAVTIHDVSVLDHPEWYDPRLRLWYRLLLPRLAKRVELILTVSEHSRRSIIRRLAVPDLRVVTIPNGVNLRRFHPGDPTAVRAKYGLPERYILFVGSLEPRKNLDRLLLAWSRLTEFQDVLLVIAGPQVGSSLPPAMTRLKRRTRHLGFIPDDDLPGLYAGAVFFIMPSLFEGFGLTVLEAMACGTPVVTSQAGALPEVAGEAALLIDPTSVEGMTEAIRLLLLEDSRRAHYRQKGLARACQFSWERSAQQIKRILSEDMQPAA
jgi:glycosyltransferase involved in cell wall biosynthesis